MTIDPMLYEESYASFLTEAQDVLQRIEQDLLSLKDDRTAAKVHSLMRSAHTLKGAAASVELESIKQVAHVLEDIFKSLYNPAVVLDTEVESLLLRGYECLRLLLVAEITGGQIDEQDILNRAAAVIAQLQDKLGDAFDRHAPMPTSSEFGVDMVQSLFEVGVEQRLTELRNAIQQGDPQDITALLQTQIDVFLGLAEFSNLPGFEAIARTTLAAMQAHPDQILTIAQLALNDFVQAQAAVLAGDRLQGGTPSLELQELAGLICILKQPAPAAAMPTVALEIIPTATGLADDQANPKEAVHTTLSLDNLFGETDQADPVDPEAEETVDTTLSLDNLFGEIDSSDPDDPSAAPPDLWTLAPLNSEEMPNPLKSNSLDFDDEWVTALPPPVSPAPSAPAPSVEHLSPELVRVESERLKHLDYLAGELLINQGKQTTQDQQLRVTLQQWRSQLQKHQQTLYELQDWIERLVPSSDNRPVLGSGISTLVGPSPFQFLSTAAQTFDALELERYSELHRLLQSALNEAAQLDTTAENLDQFSKQGRRTRNTHQRLLDQVREELTSLRMMPLRELLNRFPRLVQQLATAYGKRVELHFTGTQVLVDKAIATKLYDPLLHLLRNAFDHGIEPPDERRMQGKSDIGRIEIRANQQGNQTVIEVSDDGRGIDLQRVAQRAIALNLLTPEQVNTMPESQLLDVLFQPGFSTAPQVSDLSGRGIGLDVVNNQLRTMKGSIAVSSVPHQGTTFSLKIPLSLTTTPLLICQANGFVYALPIERVEQIVVPQPDQLQTSVGQQRVMHWQQGQEEQVVPIYLLSELMSYSAVSSAFRSESHRPHPSPGWSRQAAQPRSAPTPVLLLQTIYGRRGLLVDQILGEQELVIRATGQAIAAPPYVYGCCILGNNQSALAIDIEVLMQLTTEVEALPQPTPAPGLTSGMALGLSASTWLNSSLDRLPAASTPRPPHPPSPVILVVDDSLTLRQTVAGLLKKAGYEVIQAEDGLEALVQLQQHPHISAIICDLEMPRMNGFEFLSQSRPAVTQADIPVIVLTSRTHARHRQLALELGAVDYLTKPFNSHEFLAIVAHWLKQPTPSQLV